MSSGRHQHLTARELLAGRASGRLVVDRRERYADGLVAIRERRHDVYVIDCRLGAQSGCGRWAASSGRGTSSHRR